MGSIIAETVVSVRMFVPVLWWQLACHGPDTNGTTGLNARPLPVDLRQLLSTFAPVNAFALVDCTGQLAYTSLKQPTQAAGIKI